MNEPVKNMFDQITMPKDVADRIQNAMDQKRGQGRAFSIRRAAAMAAAFATVVLITIVSLNTEVQATVIGLFKRYVFNDNTFSVEMNEDSSHVSWDTSAPLFAEVRGGRLYFTGNGENRDITDETSLEKPFIYMFTDDQNVEHCLIVGGTPENFGIHEFFREAGVHSNPQDGWLGGYGTNYVDENERAYPWLAAAWEELRLPWPLPGDHG